MSVSVIEVNDPAQPIPALDTTISSPPERIGRVLDRLPGAAGLGQVAGENDSPGVGGDLAQGGHVASGDCDTDAAGGEHAGGGGTDTTRSAGDERAQPSQRHDH